MAGFMRVPPLVDEIKTFPFCACHFEMDIASVVCIPGAKVGRNSVGLLCPRRLLSASIRAFHGATGIHIVHLQSCYKITCVGHD